MSGGDAERQRVRTPWARRPTMTEPRMSHPYPDEPGEIGQTRSGVGVAMSAMTPHAAADLGLRLAALDPWRRVGYGAESFISFLEAREADVSRYQIVVGGGSVGAVVLRRAWLHGPYLHLIGLVPEAQGQGIGEVVVGWIEREAQGRHRNLWLCVSAFNTGARRFYERRGFTAAADLDELVFEGQTEILMRKRIGPAK
jgi:diamine N-acetyltransferase